MKTIITTTDTGVELKLIPDKDHELINFSYFTGKTISAVFAEDGKSVRFVESK